MVFRPVIRFFFLGTAMLATITLPVAIFTDIEGPSGNIPFLIAYGVAAYAIAYGYDSLIRWIDPNA